MSFIPEFILRSTLVRGIRAVRQDNKFLDQLFRNLDQESAAQMRTFIQTQKIYIDINYPRDQLKLPAIIILLRSESESQAFLADKMGLGDIPDEMSYDDTESLSDEVLGGGAASSSTLSGEGPLVFGPYKASGGTLNTLRIATREWISSQFCPPKVGTHTVHIVGGKGIGQKRTLIANGMDTLMISPNWNVIPDGTTVFLIRGEAQEVVGEPRSVYKRDNPLIERLGGLYELSYQVQIIGPNPELTVYLHAIIKSVLTLSRSILERQGIINMKMSATDFVPKTEYQPDFAYMRALNLDFLHSFEVYRELGDVASSIRVMLESAENPQLILSDTIIE